MPARRFKFLTIVWALLLAIGVIALAGSVLLPSTKRARVDWAELRRRQEAADAADAAETQPTSATTPVPASAPSTE
jgi:type II secretory pathway pseudopilin PulG